MRPRPPATVVAAITALSTAAPIARAREVAFSGYTWTVRTSNGSAVGPGPNVFSDGAENVWVDDAGRLHLRIVQRVGDWTCAEVIAQASLGYGTYRVVYDTPVDDLDANVVLGLFTWSDAPVEAHREIDVEFSRWGKPAAANAQYVVQPTTSPSRMHRFTVTHRTPSTHSFHWRAGSVLFESRAGSGTGALLQRWALVGGRIPTPRDESPRINLWLFEGTPPADGQPVEVIVSKFEWSRG
jgi:hypothetical protein